MVEQQGQHARQEHTARQRVVEGAVFAVGVLVTLAFFAFFPGMPHVIDWGAILVSLAVGAVARWGCRVWVAKSAGKRAGRG